MIDQTSAALSVTIPSRPRTPPASAGGYFAILASGFVSLVLLLLIFDQLGSPSARLTLAQVAFPGLAVLVIGALTVTNTRAGWHACNRMCPPAISAVSMLAAVFGATGLVALPGAFFFLGFDALPFTIGIMLGLVLHVVLIAPFARKDGSYTIASYLGRRFESRMLRLAAAIALTLPCLLLLIGEFKIVTFLLSHMLGIDPVVLVMSLATIAGTAVIAAGVRGAVWSGAACGLIALLALLVPVIAAIPLTNLPLPQISYGIVSAETARLEAAAGLDMNRPAAMVLTLPGSAPAALVKPFLQPFMANDPISFALLTLTIALGVAAMPALFSRAGTLTSVATLRRSGVWLICLAGAVAITLPAVAFLTRLAVLHALPANGLTDIPGWLDVLGKAQLADFDQKAAGVPISAVRFARDSVNLLLPLALEMPRPMVDVMLASALAAALAAITAEASTLAGLWCEDAVFAWSGPVELEGLRLQAARALGAIAVVLGAALSLRVKADPLTLFTWAMALSGSSVFALLVMSVWWKRINQWGAMAALLMGSLAALTQILLSLNGSAPMIFGVSGAVASILAVPLSIVVALAISLLTPVPELRMVELVRDLRVPGGETVHDREIRLARLAAPPGP